MPDPSFPLVNRGPEALQALLNHDESKAAEQVALLTLSELTTLSAAAAQLAALARKYINKTCGTCNAPITWHPQEPRHGQGWRHNDTGGALRFGVDAHQATPPVPPTPLCGHCGNPQRGYSTHESKPLCHPDDGMDCYQLVTVYGHPMTGAVEHCVRCVVQGLASTPNLVGGLSAAKSDRCPRCGTAASLGRFDVCAPCAALMGWDPECVACKDEGEGREASVAHGQTCAGAARTAANDWKPGDHALDRHDRVWTVEADRDGGVRWWLGGNDQPWPTTLVQDDFGPLRRIALVDPADLRTVLNQRHASHAHQRSGVWDDSNRPEIAGKPCVECAARQRLHTALSGDPTGNEDL